MSDTTKHPWLLMCLSHPAVSGIKGYLYVVLPEHSELPKEKHWPVKNLFLKVGAQYLRQPFLKKPEPVNTFGSDTMLLKKQ